MPQREIYSFTEILNRMITRMSTTTSISDFTPGSNIRTIFETVSHFVEYLQFLIEAAFRSFYVDTAEGEDLDNRVEDFGMERREAVFASGVETFISDTPATETFIISAGTLVSTEADVFGNTIGYELDNDITFVSGALTATGTVTCTVAGIIGNVASGTITNISTTIPGVDSVINYSAFTNGSTEENDDQLRKRIPVHLNGLQKGNEDGIKAAILAIEGITLVRMEENTPSAGYITIYVSNESGVLTDDQLDEIQEAAESAASFGIETVVSTPTVEYIVITLDADIDDVNYELEFIKQDIRDSIAERVRTNPASDLLIFDLILAATVQGVNNVKNVKINGVADDYEVSGFKVIRLNDPDVDITVNNI